MGVIVGKRSIWVRSRGVELGISSILIHFGGLQTSLRSLRAIRQILGPYVTLPVYMGSRWTENHRDVGLRWNEKLLTSSRPLTLEVVVLSANVMNQNNNNLRRKASTYRIHTWVYPSFIASSLAILVHRVNIFVEMVSMSCTQDTYSGSSQLGIA